MEQPQIDFEPFLKWAGGKRWLTSKIKALIPKDYNRYIEPFVGSAASFFSIRPEQWILSDSNSSLINCYITIRDDWRAIEANLKIHHEKHSKEYFYKVRDLTPSCLAEQAAQFIYLNRTCWNGLYRVNLKGKFNVPIGTKKSVVLNSDNFEKVAGLLAGGTITCCDFEQSVDMAQRDDFIFVDPPYTVRHNLNGFVKYNEKIFSWSDQIRLRDALLRAISRGAKVLVTNAKHQSVVELYQDFAVLSSISRPSVLAADPKFRSKIDELLICSWK